MPQFVPNKTVTSGPTTGTFVPSPGQGKKKKKKKSWFDRAVSTPAKNFAGDVVTATVGLPAATKKQAGALLGDAAQAVEDTVHVATGQNPAKANVRITKAGPLGRRTKAVASEIGKAYADYYGPLAHGDVEGFLSNVYNHPLQLTLDATTLASLGLSAGVKATLIPAKGGTVLRLTNAEGKVVSTRPLARGEMRAQLQSLTSRAKNAPVTVPKAGQVIRPAGVEAAKYSAREAKRAAHNNLAPTARFNKAVDKLTPKERVAVSLRGQYDRQALNAEISRLREVARNDPKGPAAAQLKILVDRATQKLFDTPSKNMNEAIGLSREVGEQMAQHLNIHPTTAEKRRFAPAQQAHGAVRDKETGEWVGGPSIEELKARGLDPVYFPDVSELPKRPITVEGQGGGLGIPQRTSNTRYSEGVLRDLGQVVHDPATLGQGFAKAVKYVHYDDIHKRILGMAQEASYIPDGYVAVRARRSEKVAHTDRTRSEFENWAAEHLDEAGGMKADAPFVTRSPNDAIRTANGNYLVVPQQVAKTMTGEFKKTTAFTRAMNAGPMRVWRALVLGLTPRYLTNNVIGNSLMYMMRAGSKEDIMALGSAFRSLIHPSKYDEFDRLLDRHFAGQSRGGFQATQYPSLRPKGRVTKALAAIPSAIPRMDKAFEQALRKAKVKAELKKHPGLKEKVEKMGQDTALFDRMANDPTVAVAEHARRLDSPARQAFESDIRDRFPGEADDIMALTDQMASYAAREKKIPLEEAYDDLTAGVTRAEAGDEALAQAPARPARIDEPSSSTEHAATLRALDDAHAYLVEADDAWVKAGKPKKGATADARNTAKRNYEAARTDELHQRLWDSRTQKPSTAHREARTGVIHALRQKLGKRSGVVFPKRFQTDKGALEMFDFLDELAARGKAARHWYRDSGKAILRYANGDKELAAQMAQLIAIYSPQQAVVGNLGLAMRSAEAYLRGEKIPVGQAWQKVAAHKVMSKTGGWDGRKTNNFYGNLLQHIDKKKFREEGYTGHEVTGDMWMARVFGYVTDAVAEGRYDVIESVVQQIAKERGWKPQEVQAAIWTAIKDADVDDISANVDFAGAMERNFHTINLEVTKGTEGIGQNLGHAETEAVIRELAPTLEAAAKEHRLDIRRRDFGKGGAEDIRTGPGGYEGDRNAAAYFEVSGAAEDVQAFVNDLADGFDQYEVWATREGTTGGAKPTIMIRHPELAKPEVADAFFAKLHSVMGSKAAGFSMLRNNDGIQVITTGNVTRATLPQLEADFRAAIREAAQAADLKGVKYHGTQSSVIKGKKGASERVRADLGGLEGAGGVGGRPLAAGDPATLRAALERAVGRAGGDRGAAGADRGAVAPLYQSKPRGEYKPRPDAETSDRIQNLVDHGYGNDRSEMAATLADEDELAYPGTWEETGFDRNDVLSEYLYEIDRKLGPEENLWQSGARGAFDPQTRLIHLFDKADASTVPHEFVHAIETGGGLTREHATVLERWSGHKQGTREFSEAAAQGFEQYLREGKAPTKALEGIFLRWKDLLTRLYTKASQLGTPISDEVRAVFDEILTPGGKRPQGELGAMDRVLTENPDIVNAIYDTVNDALGNYDSLSSFEKGAVRNLFPFYAWFRAITGISVKFTLDHPLAVNLFSNLANIAINEELAKAGLKPEDVPSSLRGLLVLGVDPDGRVRGINTAGANPFATVGQLADFVQAAVGLKAGEVGQKAPGLNPFLGYLAELYTGKTPMGYTSEGFSVVEGLPQVRLLKALEAQYGIDIPFLGPAATKDPLYDHDIMDELLRYLGVPYVRASKTAAKRVAEGGR